ncbi:MAG: cadherin-like domain-containing protein, partial [Acidimicrobiia bacterium]|nr:cadherin-like domain-containing protein [Acidimicrobiia bacterium]
MSLPIFTVDRASASGDSASPGIALWANATDGGSGLSWSASKSAADGLVHANRDIRISGAKNQLLGGTEYGRELLVTGSDNIIDPPATMVAATEYPLSFDIADYRPGGAAAEAAGALFYDGTAECDGDGKWDRHSRGTEIVTGLHYVPCDVTISAAEITGSFTLVAEGMISITGSRLALGPAFVDDLLLFTNSDAKDAIKIAGSRSDFDGVIFAPLGSATIAGSEHDLRCPVLANQISIKGSTHTFEGDPTCGVTIGNAPPSAELDVYATDEDVVSSVAAPGVLGNDTDPDGEPLVASVVTAPTAGTLTLEADGSFAYTPNLNFHGDDTFTYQACDPEPLCDPAEVTITVDPVNDPPVVDTAILDQVNVDSETISFDVSGNFSDVEGDTL